MFSYCVLISPDNIYYVNFLANVQPGWMKNDALHDPEPCEDGL